MTKVCQAYDKSIWAVPNSSLQGSKFQFGQRKTIIWTKENWLISYVVCVSSSPSLLPCNIAIDLSPYGFTAKADASGVDLTVATPKINFFHLRREKIADFIEVVHLARPKIKIDYTAGEVKSLRVTQMSRSCHAFATFFRWCGYGLCVPLPCEKQTYNLIKTQ